MKNILEKQNKDLKRQSKKIGKNLALKAQDLEKLSLNLIKLLKKVTPLLWDQVQNE